MRYIAMLDGKPGAYGVVVPDLPGCTSAGKTIDAAYRNAVEAVRLWVDDALEDGETIPRPRSLPEVMIDDEIRGALKTGAVLMIVPVLRDSGRAAKANISLDAGILQAIDEAAKAHGLSRSAFISSAAREKIGGGGAEVRSLLPILRERAARASRRTRRKSAR
jgi:predicted RNase H-like HicB family nuclease